MSPAAETAGRPAALFLAPFDKGELRRLAGSLHVQYESWMDSRRLHDPDELAAKLSDLGASALSDEGWRRSRERSG